MKLSFLEACIIAVIVAAVVYSADWFFWKPMVESIIRDQVNVECLKSYEHPVQKTSAVDDELWRLL